jgi:hypothetical protein
MEFVCLFVCELALTTGGTTTCQAFTGNNDMRSRSGTGEQSFISVCGVCCLCGLVIRVPGYRSQGPCSIPGSATFSEN